MKKLLIVEDEEHLRELVKMNLERNGFNCLTAVDGLEAIEVVADEMPDLVILDLKIPKLPGEEVCKKIKSEELTKNIPVIMLTAKSSIVDKVVGKVIGADCYLAKPCEIKTLVENINRLLEKNK